MSKDRLPKKRRRWLVLALCFVLAAAVAGSLLFLRGESRAQPAAGPGPGTSSSPPPGRTQAQADLTQMQSLLNSGSVSQEAALLPPGAAFASGSGPVFPGRHEGHDRARHAPP